jgi:hypothetical protein
VVLYAPARDLDFMVVGERPGFNGVDEDVDVYAASARG